MKVLDRYLTRELAIPVFYCSISLVFLILIADLFDNLDELLRYHVAIKTILTYYLALIPYAFSQTIAWAAWLGTLFLLVNLGFHNEIIAMKTAGLKITAIIKPIIFFGFLLGIATFLVNDRVVAKTFRTAYELREIYIEKKKNSNLEKTLQNVTYHSKNNELYYFRTFSKSKGEVQGVVMLWLDQEGGKTRQKMVAKRGVWKDNLWEFEGVTEYLMDSRGRILGEPRSFPKKIYPQINVPPLELSLASMESNFLTYRELKSSIQKLKQNGVNVAWEVVDLHDRLAVPWKGLVMIFMTVPILARTTSRKVIALNVLLCVGLVFLYHVVGAIGIALGKAEKLLPFVSAWGATILFAAGSLISLERTNH